MSLLRFVALLTCVFQVACVTQSTLDWRRDEVTVQGLGFEARAKSPKWVVFQVKNVGAMADGSYNLEAPADWESRAVFEGRDGILEVEPLATLSLDPNAPGRFAVAYSPPLDAEDARAPPRMEAAGSTLALSAFVVHDGSRVFRAHLFCADQRRNRWVRVAIVEVGQGSQSGARKLIGTALIPFAFVLDVATFPITFLVASYAMWRG